MKGDNMYLTYQDFSAVAGTEMTTADFDRYEFDAEMIVDQFTTGVDNVQKLRVAFPTDPLTVQAVKRCMVALTDAVCRFDRADLASLSLNGTATGGVIASVSSGSESISYATGADATSMAAAVKSDAGRQAYYYNIVRRYLGGRTDANGVGLLFGGSYPVAIGIDGVLNV